MSAAAPKSQSDGRRDPAEQPEPASAHCRGASESSRSEGPRPARDSSRRVVFTYARIVREGADVEVRVRMVWQDQEVVEMEARRVLDDTLYGERVELTDDEQDRAVIDSFGQGVA